MAAALLFAVPAVLALVAIAVLHPQGPEFALRAGVGLWIAAIVLIITRS